jgi:ankyrin repeat protein
MPVIKPLIAFALVGFCLISAGCFDRREQRLLVEHFPEERTRQLAEAAGRGDTAAIDELLSNGVAIDGSGRDGVTALWWAIRWDSKSGFEHLLRKGANVNAPIRGNYSVLDLAVRHSDIDYLKQAVAHGGDLNLANGIWGSPPLFEAVRGFNPEVVHFLIRAGADVNCRSSERTPLIVAALNRRYDYVFFLLEAGADPTFVSKDGLFSLAQVIPIAYLDTNSDLYVWREKVISHLAARGISAPRPPRETPRREPMPTNLEKWPGK